MRLAAAAEVDRLTRSGGQLRGLFRLRYEDYAVFRSPLEDFLREARRRGDPGRGGAR